MIESEQAELPQVTYAEAVKLARSRPEGGMERNDLLVRDDILQPHWHWSRLVGMTREEAVERARKVFLEDVTLVGEEMKLEKKKAEKEEKIDLEPLILTFPAPSVPEPLTLKKKEPGIRIRHAPLEVITQRVTNGVIFMAIATTAFWYLLGPHLLEILILAAATYALAVAAAAGRRAIQRRKSRAKKADMEDQPETEDSPKDQ